VVFFLILFTSDLDRTLIYSDKMMKTYPVEGEVRPVEFKNEKAISFMSQHSIDLLQRFNDEHLFVPVTTRAIYQYERIHTITKTFKPKYAITSNGGNILIDGQQDKEWNHLIQQKISQTSLHHEDLLKAFTEIRHDSWVEEEFYVDDLFYVFYVNKEKIPHEELAAFEKELFEMGWRVFLHGRKLNVLPVHVNKALAVQHVKSFVDYDIHVAAGDSILDYDMLIGANIGYSPTHGELFKVQENDSKVTWLTYKGTAATEELIRNLLGNRGMVLSI
jgi:hydroxymethylpyrimidine pyrophosphatase-like HAD family hydrolase